MMQTVNIKTQKTARINILGSVSSKTNTVWIVLHGYGELTPYFIRKFTVLENENTVVIAPEALSRFYLNGFSGRIGATWMTKEERLTDIEDYIYYLDQVYAQFVNKNMKVNVLAFSQGAATASRWIANTKYTIDNLVLWAGVFPPDLTLENFESFKKLNKIAIVYGTSDSFIKTEQIDLLTISIKNLGINTQLITFDGGHVIQENELLRVNELL